MIIWLLSFGVLIAGMLAIWFGYRQPEREFYLFKPLTMVLILLIPILGQSGFSIYKILILGGLFFSLLGDVFLMLPGDRFLEGLVAFLIGHLFYIAGFLIDQGTLIWWTVLPLILLASLMSWYLKDDLGKMRIPTYAYVGVISVMVWLAWSRWYSAGQFEQFLAFCGAVLFMISDLILALNRFKVEIRSARALDLLTYYTGQWLIALSVISLDWLGL